MNKTLIKTEAHSGLVLEVYAVEFNSGSSAIWDFFERAEKHIGGVTISNPEFTGREIQFFTPVNYSLASLASDYAKQGRENPSAEAYESAQQELGWLITADDCALLYRVTCNGIELCEDYGIGFEYSYQYNDQAIEQCALEMLRDYDESEEVLNRAFEILKTLQKVG